MCPVSALIPVTAGARAEYRAVMETTNAHLEGGPFDGRTWDISGFAIQAELTDENGRYATYFETARISTDGLPIWTVEVD
jgi:hypothetical protein